MIYEIKTNSTGRLILTPITGDGGRLGPSCTKITCIKDIIEAINEIHGDCGHTFKHGDEFVTIKEGKAKIIAQFPEGIIPPINLSIEDLRLKARASQSITESHTRKPKKKTTAAGRKLKSFRARIKYMLYMDTPGNQTLEIEADGSNDWSIGFKNSCGNYFSVSHDGTGNYNVVPSMGLPIKCARESVIDILDSIAVPE